MSTITDSAVRLPGKHFDIRRFWQLAQITGFTNGRTLILGSAIGGGTYLFFYLVSVLLKADWNGAGLAAFFFAIIGFFLNTSAFLPAHRAGTAELWLTMPASRLERFLLAWLLGSVVYTVAFYAIAMLVDLLAMGMASVIFGRAQPFMDIFTQDTGTFLLTCLSIQPVLLFGSIFFKNLPALKTFGSIMAFTGFLGFWGLICLAVAFASTRTNIVQDFNLSFINGEIQGAKVPDMSLPVQIFFQYVTPVFFLFLTWLRIGETEIHRGVR